MSDIPGMRPLTIIFAGSGEFGVPTLRSLHHLGHAIVAVYTQPDRPAGRGRTLTPTPLATAALALGLDVIRTGDFNKETLPPADVMVVVAFGQKISAAQVNHSRLGSVNLHSSRLPRHRGAAPINWAILSGDTVTGNSVIRLAERMDAGAVLAQSELAIGELETAGELHDRLAEDGAAIVPQVLDQLDADQAVELLQEEPLATVAGKLSRESAMLDWTRPAEVIARTIRGLSPWPGCRVRVVNPAGETQSTIRLIRARAVASTNDDNAPGNIDVSGHIQAGDGGVVELIEVQPDGKKSMPFADFRRGNAWGPGMRIESI